MRELYKCTNPDCDAETSVQTWPATRLDPADSTWGDGCRECGSELQQEPDVDASEATYEAEIAAAEEADLQYSDKFDE